MRQVANCVVDLALGQVQDWRSKGVRMTAAVILSVVPRRADLARRLRHRVVVARAPAGHVGRRTQTRQDVRFRLAEDPRSIAIVRSTVALAHSLGADLVAEGVEDEATLQALRLYGCNLTQGYVHTPPLPADELLEWTDRCTPATSMSDLALYPDLR
jgi:diguanylate cyclase